MRTQAIAVLTNLMLWLMHLPKMTEIMFAARTRPGRYVKTLLFGIGAILPLGSLIWALLFIHGSRIGERHAMQPASASTISRRER